MKLREFWAFAFELKYPIIIYFPPLEHSVNVLPINYDLCVERGLCRLVDKGKYMTGNAI